MGLYHRKGRVPSSALDKMHVDYEKIDIEIGRRDEELEMGISEEEDSKLLKKSEEKQAASVPVCFLHGAKLAKVMQNSEDAKTDAAKTETVSILGPFLKNVSWLG